MVKNYLRYVLAIFCILMLTATMSCGQKEEKAKALPTGSDVQKVQPAETAQTKQDTPPATVAKDQKPSQPRDVAVSVDGSVLKKDELAKRLKDKIAQLKDKIPPDKKKEAETGLKKELIDDFVIRTVLINEANRKGITATDKEIHEAMNQIKNNLPPGKKLEDFLKENNIPKEDIILGIRLKKLVELEGGGKIKPTQKDISKFYTDNQEKFITPETVHVRHILVILNEKDDEKTKAEKKDRIEKLRKQIVDGADFAEVARNNSDCPSKENGGDLGEIKRGQTVKPFEDAAFSQEKNVIGPVVTTEFGHHIIQVLDHKPGKTVKLDDVKDKITAYLEQQKQAEVFNQLTDRLRKKAFIVYYEN